MLDTNQPTYGLAVRAVLVLVSLSFFVNLGFAVPETRLIAVRDDCEPISFNAVLGPGACTLEGETTFDELIAQLLEKQRAPAWRFSPNTIGLMSGDTLVIVSRAGEVHTFTKVAAFGGGFIIPLNVLSGNPVPTPECTTGAVIIPGEVLQPQPESSTNIFVEQGERASITTGAGATLPPGTHLFECCIHPWMRATVTVSA